MSDRVSLRPPLLFILGGYVLVAILFGSINPLFEAPDEHHHFFVVETIASTGRLPIVTEEPDGFLEQEAAQPPLYYLVGAILVGGFDLSEARDEIWFNPFVRLGDASLPLNINAFVHTSDEAMPWHGYALAAHLLRLYSTLLGLGTLIFIYWSGRLLWPSSSIRPLLATAVVAFSPQFIFHHASITNDTMVIFWSAATLMLLINLWQNGVTPRRLLLIGVTTGLAALSKTAGLPLIAYAAGFALIVRWRREEGEWKNTVWRGGIDLLLVLIPAMLLSGWLLVRNWILYRDLTGMNQFVRIEGSRDVTLWQVFQEWESIANSLIAVFGWFNVRGPQWVFTFWNALFLLATVGLWIAFRKLWRQQRSTPQTMWHSDSLLPLILLGWPLVVYAGMLFFMLQTPAAQGRLLFPAIVPLAIGMALGLDTLWASIIFSGKQRVGKPLIVTGAGIALAACLASLWSIQEAYAAPQPVTRAAIPDAAVLVNHDYEFGMTLIAFEQETASATLEDVVWLTLYWERTGPIAAAETPELVAELIGPDDTLMGKLQTYQGGGLYPATLWKEDAVIVDRIGIRLDDGVFDDPSVLPVASRLQIRFAQGEIVHQLAEVKLKPASWPQPSEMQLAQIDSGIGLQRAALSASTAARGEAVTLDVLWYVATPAGRDLTTLVHVAAAGQAPIANGDATPRAGWYPTRYWETGETFSDSYTIHIPVDAPLGRYPVWIGMYEPAGRTPLTINGQRQPNDVFLVGWIEITE